MKKMLKYLSITLLILSISILQTPIAFINQAKYIEFYDKNNELIVTEIENKESEYIYLNDLNEYTINAFISFEDKNFYFHKGFDILRTIKSLFINLFSLSFKQGGSTITQQYARTLFLNNKKTLSRKIKEYYYTLKLEQKYSKNQILEGYLNTIYLGHGCYGIEAASKYYFNKHANELSLEESALLASLPSSPNNSSPFINFSKSQKRKESVLKAMKDQGYITLFEYKNAINSPIILNQNKSIKSNINYYLDQVKNKINKLNISSLKGLKVYTSLDLSLYKTIDSLIEKYKNINDHLSIIILENKTNNILFNIGGLDYSLSEYNPSINSKRQIGSTIKTFLYALALENDFSLNTELKSEPLTFNIKGYGQYSPSNANNIYANKNITMKEAFAVSDNIYAVKTLLLLGSDNFVSYLKKFNLITKESVPSIALGTNEFTLFELVNAYSVFANNGFLYNYSFIDKILDFSNNLIYESKQEKKQIIDKNISSQINELLNAPFVNENYYTTSTLENYNISGYRGKSGSTNRDSYLILFNDTYTIGLWVGNDDNKEFSDYTTTKYLGKDIANELKKSI